MSGCGKFFLALLFVMGGSGRALGQPPIFFTEFMASNSTAHADEDGDFEDWIEIFNLSNQSHSLDGVGLSDDPSRPFKWTFSGVTIEPFQFLVVFASSKDRALHTNFGLSAGGETLTLTAPGGMILDSVDTGPMRTDVSRGRTEGAPVEWPYFTEPTPGALNTTQWYLGFAEQPSISVASGLYQGPFQVTVSPGSAGDQVFVTLDGSEPDETDPPAGSPISIDRSMVVRARAFRENYVPSRAETRSYLLNEHSSLPVVLLAADPETLFDPVTGIFEFGPDPGPGPYYPTANFRKDVEIPIHVAMIEADGTRAFELDAGMEIQGGISRILPKKSLRIEAKAAYGTEAILYRVFPDKPVESFIHLLLRSSSEDQYETLFRDAVAAGLTDVTTLDRQAFRPVVLFINDQYWGIYQLGEVATEEYIHDAYGYDEDEIDVIENSSGFYEVRAGSWHNFGALIDFLLANDLEVPENYNQLQTMVDIEEILDYFAAEIFLGNTDWPDNNIRYWRPRAEGGKWRILLYDLDRAMRIENLFHDTLAYASNDQPLPPDVPPGLSHNAPEHTFFFRLLLRSPEFREELVRRFDAMRNIAFAPERVLGRIDQAQIAIWNEMPRQIDRWWADLAFPQTLDTWYQEIFEMRTFASWRPAIMDLFVAKKFGLIGQTQLTVSVDPPESGEVIVNSQRPFRYPHQGTHFRQIPVRLTASPSSGYRFRGWSGAVDSEEETILLDVGEARQVVAHFEPDDTPAPVVVINEINYSSAGDFDPGDWVELVNQGEAPADLSGWAFKDQGNLEDAEPGFLFPAGTQIPVGGLLVLCRDPALFATLFPGVGCLGGFDYGLGAGGDRVALFDDGGALMDVVSYDDAPPWPTEPDGNGPTLELLDPSLDNGLPESWGASSGHGTPGAPNGST